MCPSELKVLKAGVVGYEQNGLRMISHDTLIKLINYNPEDGSITRRSGPKSGQDATHTKGGSKIVWVSNQPLTASSLAVFYMTKKYPEKGTVRFKNENPLDLRYENIYTVPYSGFKVKKSDLSQDDVKRLFDYCPDTGVITYKRNSSTGRLRDDEYLDFRISGGPMILAHHIAWMFMTGSWPPKHVDHINRIRNDNRWENLRSATKRENAVNSCQRKDNTSGYKGVYKRSNNTWSAQATIDGKGCSFGSSFKTPEEAALAYNEGMDRFAGSDFAYRNKIHSSIEKSLILAGGKGNRLKPITLSRSKQVVPIANKPTVCYPIDSALSCGIKDIYVILSPETGKEVRSTIEDYYSNINVKFTFIMQDQPLGLAHAVLVAESYIGNSPFLMILGDNIIDYDFSKLRKDFLINSPSASLLVKGVKDPKSFGVVDIDGDKIIGLEEKPQDPKTNLALCGVYAFSPDIFEACRAITPSARGELEITHALEWLLHNGKDVAFDKVESYWLDSGKKDDLLAANRVILDHSKASYLTDGPIVGRVDCKSDLESSRITGPASIGKGCIIKNSYIGPFTSIGDNVILENVEIEDSIIISDSEIRNVSLRSSVLGSHVKVLGDGSKVFRQLFQSDNSEVVL